MLKKGLAVFLCVALISTCISMVTFASQTSKLGVYDFEDGAVSGFTGGSVVQKSDENSAYFQEKNGNYIFDPGTTDQAISLPTPATTGIITFTTDVYVDNTYVDSTDATKYSYSSSLYLKTSQNQYRTIWGVTSNAKPSFFSNCGGWSSTTVTNDTWYTLKSITNVDENWIEVYYKPIGASDSEYAPIIMQHAYQTEDFQYYDDYTNWNKTASTTLSKEDITLAKTHLLEMATNSGIETVTRFYFDNKAAYVFPKGIPTLENLTPDLKVNINTNGNTITDVSSVVFRDTNSGTSTTNLGMDHYIDNVQLETYDSIQVAMNACTTAEEAFSKLKQYQSLGAFSFGSDYTKLDSITPILNGMLENDFATAQEVQDCYDTLVAQNVKPYIVEGYEFGNIADNKVFTAGSFITDPTVSPDGSTFFYPQNTLNLTLSKAVDGIVVIDTDSYVNYLHDSDTSKRITPGAFYVRNASGAMAKIGGIVRTGAFASQSSSWSTVTIAKNEWQHFTYILNAEASKLTGYVGDGDSVKTIDWGTKKLTDSATYTEIKTPEYYYDNDPKGNGVLPSDINQIRFSLSTESGGGDALNYMDNFTLKVYKPLYQAINEATTAAGVAEILSDYAAIDAINLGEGVTDMTPICTALLNTEYTSSNSVQTAYDTLVAAEGKKVMLKSTTTDNDIISAVVLSVADTNGITLSDANKIFVVCYKDNELQSVSYPTFTAAHYALADEINLTDLSVDLSQYDSVKLMAWSDLSTNIKPLANAIALK